MYKFVIKVFVLLGILIFSEHVYAKEISFVSLSPALTEIMYALGADNMLKAVSTQCTYPEKVKEKQKIGDYFFINSELLLKIKPDYILAPDSSEFAVNKYKKFGIKPLCYKYENINDIYMNILSLGKLTGKETQALQLIKNINTKINTIRAKNKNPKKILYVVSMQPFMTIGGKSFITDIIEKSGNHSITKNINTFYPAISVEYAISQNPDIIVLDYYCFSNGRIEKLFPNTKIVSMTKEQSDIIDRPATRIYKSVEFFANLSK